MSTIKRVTSVLLALVMTLSCMCLTAFASEQAVIKAVSSSAQVHNNDTFTVTVSVSALEKGIGYFQLRIDYDESKVQYVSASRLTLGDAFNDTKSITDETSGGNKYIDAQFLSSDDDGVINSEESDLFSVTFKVITDEAGTIALPISYVDAYYADYEEIAHSVTDATVVIPKTPITAASATVAAPAKGQPFPSTVVCGATSYSGSVAWFTDDNCVTPAGSTVRGGTAYYAQITLTPDKANGESFADSVNVTVGESGFDACAPDANGNIVVVVPFTTAARVLSGIAITTAPTKTAYEVGDTFDPAGMVVTANYDDGTSQVITDYTYAPNGALAATDTAVTVSYSDKQTAQTITVSKKTPTTPGYTNGSATYDGTTDYAETAKAAISGFTEGVMGTLDIIFKLGNNTVEKLVDAGVYTVSVKSDGNDTYSPLSETELGTFTVDKAAITPTVSLTGWTYGGTANTPSVSGNSGNGAVTYSYKVKGAADSTYDAKMPTDAGSYTVKAVVAESDNYLGGQDTADFTIAKATVTAPAIAGKTYTGEKLTADVAESDVYTIVNNGGTNVGNYDVVLTLKDSTNYKWSDSDNAAKTLTFTISKATASAVATPTPAAVTYDPAKTLANVTLPQGWSWSAPATVPTVVNSGYSAVLTVDDANYDYTGVEGYNATAHTVTRTVSLTVNPADSVAATVTANNRTYDGTQQALVTVTGTAVGGDMEYRLNDGDWSTFIPTATNAGKYTVAYRVNADSNHSTFTGPALEVTIAPKAVTITANNAAKTFGQSDPALTATVSGTVGSDVIAATASRAIGNDVGEYAITAAIDAGNSSYIADNYDITFVNGKFTISQADNSISSLSISGWTYGDSANAPSATAAFGTVAYTYGASQNGPFTATVPTNAGTWYVKAAAAGTDNYKAAESVTSFTIGQREVTLNWGTSEFTYDGQSHVPAVTLGNVRSGDTVNVTVTGAQIDAGNNYTATAESLSNSNYKLPESATHSFSIAKASIAEGQLSGEMTVRSNAAKAVSFTLPALPQGASYGTPAVGTNTDGVINSSSAPTVSGNTLSFFVTAQTKDKTGTITVPVNGGTNYNNATFTLTVTTKDKDDAGVTVTASKSSVTYGDSVTVSGSAKSEAGSGTWSWSSSNGSVIAVSGTTASPTVTVVGVGEATITGTFENDDYLGTNTVTVTVTQREVTLTWGTTSFTYNGESHLPTVTLGNLKSGDTVTANVTGAQTNAGDYTATVESLSNSNYKLPETTTRSFSIAKASASVTTAPAANSLTYNSGAQALVSAGAAQGGTMEYRLGTSGDWSSEVPSATDAGAYTVYYRVAGDSNHNNTAAASVAVTIAKANAAVTTAPAANTLTYTGSAQTLVSAGNAQGGSIRYKLNNGAWGTTVPTATNAGSYTVYYKVVGDDNHNNAAEQSISVTIARKSVTVTANNASKVYNAADPALTATVSGTVGNDTVKYTIGRTQGNNVGSYAITPTGAATQGNYTVSFIPGTFTITKATNAVSGLTITGWTYGNKANAPSAKATFGTVVYTYSSAENGDFTAAVPVNAGTWYVKAAVTGNDNYDSAQAVKSFTIAPKAVTITANNASKVYGEADPTLTATVSGVVSGDTIVATASRADGNNVGSYTISAAVDTNSSQYTVGNYNISLVNATFTINPKAVTVKANDAEKTYGEKDPQLTATVTGLLGEDSITYDVTRKEGDNAGTYTITASGAASQGNYSVTYVTGKFTVKPLTGDQVATGEGVDEMTDSQSKDFTDDLANVEQFTDDAVGIEAGDSDEVKQEKRETAVKNALIKVSGASAANTSGLYFVSANSAAASQIVLAVPNGVSSSNSYNYKVMYMAADGTIKEVSSQLTANGIVAEVAEGADGVYMVAYTPKPVHAVDDATQTSGDQSIITDLTDINKVTVDGKTVDPRYYTVSGGVVTISEAYLRTLSNGRHTVRVENAKYISTAVITVNNSTVKSAGTGDAGLGLYAMLVLSSVTGAAWLGLKKRKED